MTSRFSYCAGILVVFSGLAWGQVFAPVAVSSAALSSTPGDNTLVYSSAPDLPVPAALPRMAPELALQVYQGRMNLQSQQLAGYSAVTVIHAELPDTAQQGEYELQRHFAAPHTLEFKALRYTGDGFVKSNVITRLLQSEVDHVQKDDTALTAITNANYKFSYKGTSQVNGHLAHAFQLKPRSKRPGLFKGRIYINAFTGSLVRAEGGVVKSPSFFIKKIEFVQDYADVGSFTFPVYIHTEARARVIGRTVVDIYHRDYQPVASQEQAAGQVAAFSQPSE